MRIKEARLSKNLRQKELASIIGVAANTLSQYESGKREPDFATFQKIADALMVSTDYLLGRADQKEMPAPTERDGEPVFGEHLKEFRVSKKLSQKELAAKLFVSAQAVSKWERNEATPNPEAIVKISQIFGISTDELLGCSEGKKAPAPTEDVPIGTYTTVPDTPQVSLPALEVAFAYDKTTPELQAAVRRVLGLK